MEYLIDTHAHIDMYENPREICQAAFGDGVKKIIIPSVEQKFFNKILNIANEIDNVYCMLGIFPSEAKNWDDEISSEIKELSKNPKVVGIGEIGLDYYWDKTFNDKQQEIFIKQIKLANELNLPIAVHDREAHKDTFDILKKYNNGSDVVFHCFSGSKEFAAECVKQGWYIALGGVVTFKNAIKAKETAAIVPWDKLLLETDSPYLAPVPYRGKENRPAYINYTAREIASIRQVTLEEVMGYTSENAERVFGI